MTSLIVTVIFTIDRFPSVARFYNRASKMLVWPYSPQKNVVIRVSMMRAMNDVGSSLYSFYIFIVSLSFRNINETTTKVI